MKSILLIGLGRFGTYVAQKLNSLNEQVMAIDSNEERVNAILPYVTSAQIGDSTNEAFMSTLGVDDYDVCIVAIGDDFQSSLETTCLLKELGAKKVIARASKGTQEKFLLNNGADEVVFPEKQLASWTAFRCASDGIIDYMELDNSHAIIEMSVPKAWANKTILELDLRKKHGLNILGIKKNKQMTSSVLPNTLLDNTMSILVLGEISEIERCLKLFK